MPFISVNFPLFHMSEQTVSLRHDPTVQTVVFKVDQKQEKNSYFNHFIKKVWSSSSRSFSDEVLLSVSVRPGHHISELSRRYQSDEEQQKKDCVENQRFSECFTPQILPRLVETHYCFCF